MPKVSIRLSVSVVIGLIAFSTLLAACGNANFVENTALELASMSDMPPEVQSAPLTVQQAYQFNAANPEVMTQIPCYCGCGSMGHTSNYSCYISGEDADGNLTYDTHALGCSICVDITQDTMRLYQQGQTVSEIKFYIDQTYAQYGPSNMP